ncbi:protein FAM47E-like [Morphnus guianensis]
MNIFLFMNAYCYHMQRSLSGKNQDLRIKKLNPLEDKGKIVCFLPPALLPKHFDGANFKRDSLSQDSYLAQIYHCVEPSEGSFPVSVGLIMNVPDAMQGQHPLEKAGIILAVGANVYQCCHLVCKDGMEESNTVAGIACCGAQTHFDARKNINTVRIKEDLNEFHNCKSLCYHARGVPQVVFGGCHGQPPTSVPFNNLNHLGNSRREKMSYKDFRESRLRFSDSLNGQRWIFLKKGLDDFRDGFPPSSNNMIVYGRKWPVSITLQNRTLKSLSTVPWKKRKKCAKTQVCLSKLSPLQQARRDYVAQIECCLNQQPLILYSRLEKSISAKERESSETFGRDRLHATEDGLLREVAGVPDPEMLLKSKSGYNDYEQENQPLQEVPDHTEDTQSKVTAAETRVHGTESRGKNRCTRLPKKVAAREKEAMPTDFIPPDEHVKRVTKHFCDWVMSLGGGNCSVDEDTLVSLLNTSCEREATVPSPFHAVKFNTAEAEQPKSQEISPPQLAIRSSHHLRSLSCQVKDLSQTKWEKIRYGAWYLDPKTWRKQKANEPLKAPEATINSLGNAKNRSEKEMEVTQLHSTQAFKDFLERKGYRKPWFLLKMLAGGNDSRAPEETSKACKKVTEEIRQNKRSYFRDCELIQISKLS